MERVKQGVSINVTDPETGESFVYTEGEAVPDEHVALVSHDYAWQKDDDDDDDQELFAARKATASDPDGDPPAPTGGNVGAGGTAGGVASSEGDNLDDLSVRGLHDVAESENIDLGDATRKADIIAAIRAARATA